MMSTHVNLHAQLNYLNLLTCLQAAESLLDSDGDFLVRDSSSAPGDYVLSCFWKTGPLHFKIIRVVLRPKKVCLCCVCLCAAKWGVNRCSFYGHFSLFSNIFQTK